MFRRIKKKIRFQWTNRTQQPHTHSYFYKCEQLMSNSQWLKKNIVYEKHVKKEEIHGEPGKREQQRDEFCMRYFSITAISNTHTNIFLINSKTLGTLLSLVKREKDQKSWGWVG